MANEHVIPELSDGLEFPDSTTLRLSVAKWNIYLETCFELILTKCAGTTGTWRIGPIRFWTRNVGNSSAGIPCMQVVPCRGQNYFWLSFDQVPAQLALGALAKLGKTPRHVTSSRETPNRDCTSQDQIPPAEHHLRKWQGYSASSYTFPTTISSAFNALTTATDWSAIVALLEFSAGLVIDSLEFREVITYQCYHSVRPQSKDKIGAGCGGCMPLAANIFKADMKKTGHAVSNHLCPHFGMARQELFSVVKIRKLKKFPEIMEVAGVKKDSLGCEICKPAIGSILSSLYNELVLAPVHHANQDTNDRYLANIQRNGTFPVVPRVAGGEITPDKLIVLGQVANKCGVWLLTHEDCERLKTILLDDELGICADLEREMGELIGSYADEWKAVVNDPARRRQFHQFVNSNERRPQTEVITERGQERPADWPKRLSPAKLGESVIVLSGSGESWPPSMILYQLMTLPRLLLSSMVTRNWLSFTFPGGATLPRNRCDHTSGLSCSITELLAMTWMAISTSHASPLHKRNFRLTDGKCLNDEDFSIIPFDVKRGGDDLLVLLPDSDNLDAAIGTSKWMVKQASAELSSRGGGEGIEIASVGIGLFESGSVCAGGQSSCSGGNASLEW
ncbi:hypothetical protein BDR03DRAFT_986432 [Suillus americanus]|nr:hypothetical protein BDR03DRAFT_986432 [Suillus americanus]